MNFGPLEIGLLVLVALVLFGPKKLPELGKSLGRGIREFKKSTRELGQDLELVASDAPSESRSDPLAFTSPLEGAFP